MLHEGEDSFFIKKKQLQSGVKQKVVIPHDPP